MVSYQIPGFKNYRVEIEIGTESLCVKNLKAGRCRKINSTRVTFERHKKSVSIQTIKLIALAFHGHPGPDQVAYYAGGGYAPHTVYYISRKAMMQIKRGLFTTRQRERIGKRIKNSDVTYHQLAEEYNCSYTTIARIAQEQLQKY